MFVFVAAMPATVLIVHVWGAAAARLQAKKKERNAVASAGIASVYCSLERHTAATCMRNQGKLDINPVIGPKVLHCPSTWKAPPPETKTSMCGV